VRRVDLGEGGVVARRAFRLRNQLIPNAHRRKQLPAVAPEKWREKMRPVFNFAPRG
jgi:hypothetical protein